MEKYWQTIVRTDVAELGGHSECIDCMLKKELCSPCRWKAMVEETTAKEWVYSVIAAEAITERSHTGTAPKQRLHCFILNGGHNATNPKHQV